MLEEQKFTAITVRQPWASLLVLGIKKVETRSFKVFKDFRGRLFIHAGRVDYQAYIEYEKNEEFRYYCNMAFERLYSNRPRQCKIENENQWANMTYIMSWKYFQSAWPTKSIIGCVNLHDCQEAFMLKKTWEKAGKIIDWEREYYLGDLSSDRFAWMCKDPHKFERPIENVRGQLGMWNASKYLQSTDYIS
jgi:hypothetical protein